MFICGYMYVIDKFKMKLISGYIHGGGVEQGYLDI